MRKLLKILIQSNDFSQIQSKIESSPFLNSILKSSNNNREIFIYELSSSIQKANLEEFKTAQVLLTSKIQFLKGVGPKRALFLNIRGVDTVEKLLKIIPNSYRDYSSIKSINQVNNGELATLKLKFLSVNEKRYFKKRVLEAIFYDETGKISLKWFNYKINYLKEFFVQDKIFTVFGKINVFNFNREIIHPVIEEYEEVSQHLIKPVYPSIKGFSNKVFTDTIANIFDKLKALQYEFLPAHIILKRELPDISDTYQRLHFPVSIKEQNLFLKRLIYNEFFFFMLAISRNRDRQQKMVLSPTILKGELIKPLLRDLPFKLTKAQRKVLSEIRGDFESGKVLNRLIQGDVGSGKTLVAFISALIVIENKGQAAFMVPTEILAEQHFKNFTKYNLNLKIALLTGSTLKREREDILKNLESGDIDLVVGTHTLIQESIKFNNIRLNIVDEQHRFGVRQRMLLKEKSQFVHTIIMTATPIPRTLTLTLYGDLDVSVIDELPIGRKPIKTFHILETKRDLILKNIKNELDKGSQAYFIYPLIDDSDKMELKSVLKMSDIIKNQYFPQYRVGLLHGKMGQREKEAVMDDFAKHHFDILVSTTVIEVGIDIPNATVIVIENCERFGLSQLHQLRGRVGRGDKESFCYLISSKNITSEGRERLNVMVESNDGFKIAEADLKIRGSGEMSGTKQAGIGEFQFADIIRDYNIMLQAREDADSIVKFDPSLSKFPLLKEKFEEFLMAKDNFISIG